MEVPRNNDQYDELKFKDIGHIRLHWRVALSLKGGKSFVRLEEIHPKLQMLVDKVAQQHDFYIVCGKRTMAEQVRFVELGKSKTLNSKHLEQPDGFAWAVDVAPDQPDGKIDWEDIQSFIALIGAFKFAAKVYDIKIRCGADWERFRDYPHIELVEV